MQSNCCSQKTQLIKQKSLPGWNISPWVTRNPTGNWHWSLVAHCTWVVVRTYCRGHLFHLVTKEKCHDWPRNCLLACLNIAIRYHVEQGGEKVICDVTKHWTQNAATLNCQERCDQWWNNAISVTGWQDSCFLIVFEAPSIGMRSHLFWNIHTSLKVESPSLVRCCFSKYVCHNATYICMFIIIISASFNSGLEASSAAGIH